MQRSSLLGCTPNPTRNDDVKPVLWLGALIFLASLVGCIATIVLAWRHADAPVETAGARVMKVPTGHQAGAR